MTRSPRIPTTLSMLLWAGAAAHAQTAPEQAAQEAGGPRWEAGLVTGAAHVPDYPGAGQSHLRGLVAPVFIYRGPVLRIDEGGVRGRLFDSPQWRFELTGTVAFNARDNAARAGMPGLDYLFGVGPQLVYKGLPLFGHPSLHLKTRAVFSTDFHRITQRGMTFDPEVRWRLRGVAGPASTLSVSIQPTWASGALQRYFYQVDPGQATATRRAYRAHAGYLGTEASLTLSRRRSASLLWFVSARGMSLHGAANSRSPLLQDRSNFTLAAGLVWTPWRSTTCADCGAP